MSIKILIHTVTTRPDTCGNRYSAACVTNPRNGKSFRLEMGWGDGSNVRYMAREWGFDHSEIYHTEADGLTRKELKWFERNAAGNEYDFPECMREIGFRKRGEAKA